MNRPLYRRCSSLAGQALAFVIVLGSTALGQCPAWSTSFDEQEVGTFVGAGERIIASTVFDDGSGPALYVAGVFSTAGSAAVNNIAKWNGSSWSALGAGLTPAGVTCLAVYDDGSGAALYAGGTFTTSGATSASKVAKWDGSSWSAISTGMNGTVTALHVFDDGAGSALYLGGGFTTAGGVSADRVAKWDGTSFSALSTGVGTGSVSAITHFDDGSGDALYVAGNFTVASGAPGEAVAKWDGTSWSALGAGITGGNASVKALAVYDAGGGPLLYAGGAFTTAGSTSVTNIAAWDGSTWTALGAGIGGPIGPIVQVLLPYDDGSGTQLFAGGHYQMAGTLNTNDIAKWNGTAWSSVGSGTHLGQISALVPFNDGDGLALVCAGGICMSDNHIANRISKWTGQYWATFDSGLNGDVHAFCTYDAGTGCGPALYAGGSFSTNCGVSDINGLARWTGAGWELLSASTAGGSGTDGTVNALVPYDDGSGEALFFAGSFTVAGGTSASNIAEWTPSAWSALGSGTNGTVSALAVFDSGSGDELYAGGTFTSAGATAVTNIARWNGSVWSAVSSGLGGGTSPVVLCMTLFDDGGGTALYAGGTFTTAGGTSASNIARWDGSSWSALSTGTNGPVRALAVHDDGSGDALFAGGSFTTAGGGSARGVAKWSGSTWSGVAGGTSGATKALAVFDDGTGGGTRLYAGGSFTLTGVSGSNNIGSYDGSAWSALATGVDAEVLALHVFSGGSAGVARLFAGGAFTNANSSPSNHVASWESCGSATGTPYCFGDGTGAFCPCVCQTSSLGTGCRNSSGDGARISGSGLAQVSSDSVVLHGQGMPTTGPTALFFQGTAQVGVAGRGVFFGDGLRCAGGTVVRLGAKTATGGVADFGAGIGTDPNVSVAGSVPSGGATRHYQIYYRNSVSFCTAATWNMSNALTIVWIP
jgi:trimeric autotransporter adhesin